MSTLFNAIVNNIEESEINKYNEKLYLESVNSIPEDSEGVIFESIIGNESVIENEGWFKKIFRSIIRFFKFRNASKVEYDLSVLKDVNPNLVSSENKSIHVREETLALLKEILDRGKDENQDLARIVGANRRELDEYTKFINEALPGWFRRLIRWLPNYKPDDNLTYTTTMYMTIGNTTYMSTTVEYVLKKRLDRDTSAILNLMAKCINSLAGNSEGDDTRVTETTLKKLNELYDRLRKSDNSQYDATPEQQKNYADFIKKYQPELYSSAAVIKELSVERPVRKSEVLYEKFKNYTQDQITKDNAEKLSEIVDAFDILQKINEKLADIFGKIIKDMRTM